MKDKDWGMFIEKTIGGYISTALKYTKSFVEAEDIVWGVYAKLLEKDYLLQDLPNIGLKSIHNASLNHIKYQAHRRHLEIDDYHPPFYPPTEAKVDMDICMDSLSMHLPSTEEDVFRSYLRGALYREIAITHNIPMGTVKSSIHRSKNKLKKAYPEYAKI